MQQIPWFDRKFDFGFQQNIFPAIIERLDGTPIRLNAKIAKISADKLELRVNDSWSIKENVGHLINLEPLWQGRLEDILSGKKYLRATDLSNQQTDRADYNAQSIEALLQEFLEVRQVTVNRLTTLSEPQIYQTALHPRLEQPMRTMDLFLFVAEHDDHHLARITEIAQTN